MSAVFRELLKKVGSGPHTSEDLSRAESASAMRMMLMKEATPAQIGAFLIAHRIKRPTGEELAGMLDAYDELGPKLQGSDSNEPPVMVFNSPYDGRDRTAPVTPLTALILTAVGQPVVIPGGGVMPTKYGIPLVDIWQGLGVDFSKLTLAQAQQVFEKTKLGCVYLPQHFPLAYEMVEYRDQLGKRPPIATLELIWCPYAGNAHVVSGFVHPPTEQMFQKAVALRGTPGNYTTVKGLEGSCDLPRDRTAIIGFGSPGSDIERLLLHPRDYDMAGKEVPLESAAQLIEQMQAAIAGKSCDLMPAAIWNAGFYLWRCGATPDLQSGLTKAEALFTNGIAAQKLQELSAAVAALQLAPR